MMENSENEFMTSFIEGRGFTSKTSSPGTSSDSEDDSNQGQGKNSESEEDSDSSSSSASSSDDDDDDEPCAKAHRSNDHEKKKKKGSKLVHQRRNIRKLLTEKELDAETLAAQKEEEERKKRLQEIQIRAAQAAMAARAQQFSNYPSSAYNISDLTLRMLLGMNSQYFNRSYEADSSNKMHLEQQKKLIDDDVIILDSDEEENLATTKQPLPEKKLPKRDSDVIEVSSSDDEVVMVGSDHGEDKDEESDNDDLTSGCHVNDTMNQPDALGRVLVNVGHPPDEPDIFLLPQLAKAVKAHQIGGIRFLYDNLVESLSRYHSSNGFGCILAHSMGLGKTLQVICFIDVFLRHTGAHTVLCIVPINTLQNWAAEFNHWVPTKDNIPVEKQQEYSPREFNLFILNDNVKMMTARAKVVTDWRKSGGVLLVGYEMYRLLSSRKMTTFKPKKKKTFSKPPFTTPIDIEEEERSIELYEEMCRCLIRPGPDLVICDEGHRIKNSHAGISQALKNIRTRRRVVLTGYPLQNNLLEYWCMVDFVRPNFLGTKAEFCNMFERPILNGQCLDSTPQDVKLMRFRAHVLHSLLEGFVQRRGHAVLRLTLPQKEEHILQISMSPIQKKLYREFMNDFRTGVNSLCCSNPLKAFAVGCKIWNHPDVLYSIVGEKKTLDDDIDLADLENASKKKPLNQNSCSIMDAVQSHVTLGPPPKQEQIVSYGWAKDLLKDYVPGVIENSGKVVIFFEILTQSINCGDKLLVFSQSLLTLNLLEEYLVKHDVPISPYTPPDAPSEKWCKNKNYFRLDGSTNSLEREKLINHFNMPDNHTQWLFLLSTRAGCLGINLVGANRVIVFDASWNPCHDAQAVCRVYRYGQTKTCFIYRLVMDSTLEKKIYDRQISKQGMSDRVVDELQPEANFSRREVDNFLHYDEAEELEVSLKTFVENGTDPILNLICKQHSKWLTKEPFLHESLLLDRKDQKLTKSEKRLAKQSYELEKKANVSYVRSNYAPYYSDANYTQPSSNIRFGVPNNHHRPVANVRPMQSTPIPMHPRPISSSSNFPLETLLRHGVTVQQITATTEIVIPSTNSASYSTARIRTGEQLFLIKTTRGSYIRTIDGKIFAIRSTFSQDNPQPATSSSYSGAMNYGLPYNHDMDLSRSQDPNLPYSMSSWSPWISAVRQYGHPNLGINSKQQNLYPESSRGYTPYSQPSSMTLQKDRLAVESEVIELSDEEIDKSSSKLQRASENFSNNDICKLSVESSDSLLQQIVSSLPSGNRSTNLPTVPAGIVPLLAQTQTSRQNMPSEPILPFNRIESSSRTNSMVSDKNFRFPLP